MLDEEKELRRQIEEELAVTRKTQENSEEFNNFLRKVTDIESIIDGLASQDKKEVGKALMKAELYLQDPSANKNIDENNCILRDKINKTVINQAAFDALGKATEDEQQSMSPDIFMKTIEADAKQRSEDRKQRKEISDRYKLQGNKAFREKDYEKALTCYNKAIIALKDSALLYTNRALTCLKLRLNQRALDDSTTALKLNEHSIKGFIYKAEALYNLRRMEESEETIQEACKDMPDKSNFFKEVQLTWISKHEGN